ncbi:AC102-like protein [Orgyia pseudotsugata single capsid nuclopolyhedrovirus]|nr:AC102-like protein [Orgyia pseudotsugata single capsid nuclopolyhedrovirus]
MPNRLIDTLLDSGDDDDNNPVAAKRQKRNRKAQTTTTAPAHQINATDLLAMAEKNDTVAKSIIADDSIQKMDSFKALSRTSAVAKSIFNDIENNRNDMRLDTLRATNVLRFLSNVYDNQL